MRFHVPGLAHTKTNKEYCACAFTQKVWKLCEMLTKRGHTVIHYGVEGSNPICTENVITATKKLQDKCVTNDWKQSMFEYNQEDELHKTFEANTVSEIRARMQPHDFFLASWGYGHKAISDKIQDQCIVVEPGIGYDATYAKYRVFESYTWMGYVYGRQNLADGNFYDAVIPNYFDPKDFTYNDKKEDFFLYLGRIVKRKGVELAIQVAETLGKKIVLAGQGTLKNEREGIDIKSNAIEFVGYADVEKRRDLMSRAKLVFLPTYYIEPFGGVAVEAMMSGTPVITTDWGVFNETILHGITGYRCRTFDQFCWAASNIDTISNKDCRDWALKNFSVERVAPMFEEYFQMLSDLYTTKQGWYNRNFDRKQLDWLVKKYPSKEVKNTTTHVFSPPITLENEDAVRKERGVPIVRPIENVEGYDLNLAWYETPKQPGISFLVRAKNEERTIGLALDSLRQIKLPHEINVFINQCSDNSLNEVLKRKEAGQNINIYNYKYSQAHAGLQHFVTPANSVHSLVWMMMWTMMQGKYSYTFKWDADFIMTSQLAEEINTYVTRADIDVYGIAAASLDGIKDNVEPYLFSNANYPRYIKVACVDDPKFGADQAELKTCRLQGKIIHDSPISLEKSYWNDPFWWDVERDIVDEATWTDAKHKYETLSKELEQAQITPNSKASAPEAGKLWDYLGQRFPQSQEIGILRNYVFQRVLEIRQGKTT
jgi:hypothetical protein